MNILLNRVFKQELSIIDPFQLEKLEEEWKYLVYGVSWDVAGLGKYNMLTIKNPEGDYLTYGSFDTVFVDPLWYKIVYGSHYLDALAPGDKLLNVTLIFGTAVTFTLHYKANLQRNMFYPENGIEMTRLRTGVR